MCHFHLALPTFDVGWREENGREREKKNKSSIFFACAIAQHRVSFLPRLSSCMSVTDSSQDVKVLSSPSLPLLSCLHRQRARRLRRRHIGVNEKPS